MSGRLDRIGTRAFLRALKRERGRRIPQGEACIATLLRARAPAAVPTADLVAALYEDDPTGGTLWAEERVRVAVHRLRRKGIPVTHRIGFGYCIEARDR